MTAIDVVQAVHAGAAVESSILDSLTPEPLPLHEVARRVGHTIPNTETFLRLLRARGAVVFLPGPDTIVRRTA